MTRDKSAKFANAARIARSESNAHLRELTAMTAERDRLREALERIAREGPMTHYAQPPSPMYATMRLDGGVWCAAVARDALAITATKDGAR